jgi:MFS family permease
MSKGISTFRALQSRNYRLYFFGQTVSLIGTWMQRTAVSWVVYSLTHSTVMLGLIYFASQFPTFLLSLFGGVISDRYNRYKVLLITQIASMIQATLLALLIIFGNATVWEILGLSVVLGCINAFDVPSRQSLIYDMVNKKEDLPNALALNSSMVNLARLAGPAIAGIVLERFGDSVCFLSNAASFLAVIVSLLLMKLPKYLPNPKTKNVFGELKEGFTYLRSTPSIGNIILMLAVVSFLVLPFNTLLPVYAKVVFKGSASTFGYINSFIGLGSISGAIFLASLKEGSDLKKILMINTLLMGVGLILFSHQSQFILAMLFAVAIGFGMMSQSTISNTIIQTTAAKHMRGRVISYFAMAFFGMQPLGSLLIGFVSQYVGSPVTILSEGICAIIIALIFRPLLKKERLSADEKVIMDEIEQETIQIK